MIRMTAPGRSIIRPVRIYLDTSDYGAMHYAAPGSEIAVIRDQLRELARSGQIEIGLSYHVVFELLQKATPEHREDRLARARLLKELCGQNAFPYGRDLGQGHVFSKEGIWVPRFALDEFEVERLVADLLKHVRRDPLFTREQRRRLSKRQAFAAYVRGEPTVLRLLVGEKWPLPFGREFAASGDLRRYILGETTREEANRKLWVHLTDPVMFYETWFERYGRGNPLETRGEELASMLMAMFEKLQAMLDEEAALRADVKKALNAKGEDALNAEDRGKLTKVLSDLKTFRAEIKSPDDLTERVPAWKKTVGEKSARLAAQIMFAFHRDKRRLERSDAVDFIHAMYLPYTDLWRGDRAFGGLLTRHKVDYWERVVPTLTELPSRIEAELTKQAA